ncbi:MAG: hypothetical protein MZU95_17525 [Desulfomicrobium escambiense]|nr:hypothetical protein [Desulfomicrobium escambiense]
MATNRFSGVLSLAVDATALVEQVSKGIRSGKTGYSRVIDNKGAFLYHPEVRVHREDLPLEARVEKRPTISFARINEIPKDLMMAGKEGMSCQEASGWLSGDGGGEMKKTSRLHADQARTGPGATDLRSVAVVAPISEIAEAIRGIQVRQFLLEGIGILVVLCGGLFHSWGLCSAGRAR